MRGQDFLLDAADGQNFASKGDLARHGHIAANRNVREGTDNGGTNRDARRRAVFRNGALRYVHVDIEVAIEIVRQAEGRGARAHVTHGRLRGFLHNVAELAGKSEPESAQRSEEHTSELQSLTNLVCRLLLEKKKQHNGEDLTKKQKAHT